IGEKPDETTAGGNRWTLVETPAQANDTEDFVFLEREAHKNFPRYVEGVACNVVLKINARIEFDARAGMIVHNVLKSQMAVERLKMIGQPVVSATEIEPFVFDAGPKVPFTGNQEAVVVAKIVVERIAVTKFTVIVAEIAAQRVGALRGKKIVRILLLWRGRGLNLGFRARKDESGGSEKQRSEHEREFFHDCWRERMSIYRMNQPRPMYRITTIPQGGISKNLSWGDFLD